MFDVLTFSISFYKAAMHGSHCLQFQGRDLSAHELLNKFRSSTTRIYIGAATAAEAQRNNSGRRDLPTMSIPSASSTLAGLSLRFEVGGDILKVDGTFYLIVLFLNTFL